MMTVGGRGWVVEGTGYRVSVWWWWVITVRQGWVGVDVSSRRYRVWGQCLAVGHRCLAVSCRFQVAGSGPDR